MSDLRETYFENKTRALRGSFSRFDRIYYVAFRRDVYWKFHVLKMSSPGPAEGKTKRRLTSAIP